MWITYEEGPHDERKYQELPDHFTILFGDKDGSYPNEALDLRMNDGELEAWSNCGQWRRTGVIQECAVVGYAGEDAGLRISRVEIKEVVE